MIAHNTASATSNQSRFSLAHQQFNERIQVSLASSCSSDSAVAVSTDNIDSVQLTSARVASAQLQTSTTDTSSAPTPILSTAQKKRVSNIINV